MRYRAVAESSSKGRNTDAASPGRGRQKGDRAAGGAMHAETVDTHLFSDATDLMLADQRFQLASEFVCNFRR